MSDGSLIIRQYGVVTYTSVKIGLWRHRYESQIAGCQGAHTFKNILTRIRNVFGEFKDSRIYIYFLIKPYL